MCVQPRRVDRRSMYGQQAGPSTSFVDSTIDFRDEIFRVRNVTKF